MSQDEGSSGGGGGGRDELVVTPPPMAEFVFTCAYVVATKSGHQASITSVGDAITRALEGEDSQESLSLLYGLEIGSNAVLRFTGTSPEDTAGDAAPQRSPLLILRVRHQHFSLKDDTYSMFVGARETRFFQGKMCDRP